MLILFILLLPVVLVVLLFSIPVFYRLSFQCDRKAGAEEGKEENGPEGKLKVSLLFGLIRIYAEYPFENGIKVRILCFTLPSSQKKHSRKEEEQEQKEKKKKDGQEPEKKTIPEKKEQFLALCRKVQAYTPLFRRVVHRLLKIGKSIFPKAGKGSIAFGTGQPDTTGYLMGIYGMLSPVAGNAITVTPDFEHRILQAQLWIRGRIFPFAVLHHGLRILLDPDLLKLLKGRRVGGRKNG